MVQKLVEAGIHGLAHLLEMSDDELGAIEGVGPKTIETVREAATQARLEWEARDAADEAERAAAEHAQAEEAPPENAAAAEPATEAEAPEAATAAEGTGQSPQEDATDGER
jgi:hypothetical protein